MWNSEPEQCMWQRNKKVGGASTHTQGLQLGKGGFNMDKWHIKASGLATAAAWGLAWMGESCLLVVSCSFLFLQPLFLCTNICQILSFDFLSLMAPLTPIPWLLLLTKPPMEKHSGSRMKPLHLLHITGAAQGNHAQATLFLAMATVQGVCWHPHCSHRSQLLGPPGSLGRAQGQPSCQSLFGRGTWTQAMRASPGATAKDVPGLPGQCFQPLPSAPRRKNRPVLPQRCQGDIFLAAALSLATELAGAACWMLGQPLCPHTEVLLPRATQHHGTTSHGMQAGSSGWEPSTEVGAQQDPRGAMQR